MEKIMHEAIALILIAVFGLTFYTSVENQALYWAFIVLSLALYYVSRAEEADKRFHDYFHHTSSFFLASTAFFVISLAILKLYSSEFLKLTLSLAIILLSVGFMRLIFARLK